MCLISPSDERNYEDMQKNKVDLLIEEIKDFIRFATTSRKTIFEMSPLWHPYFAYKLDIRIH